MKRFEADSSLKWKFEDIFSSHSKWEEEYNFLNSEKDKFILFKNKLNNKQTFLECLKFEEEFNKRFELLCNYILLQHDVNLKDAQYLEDLERIEILSNKITQLTTFVMPELKEIDDEFYYELLKDKSFSNYKYGIENILNSKKHILSHQQEEALSTTSKYDGGFGDIFDALTADFKYKSVIVDGKEEMLSEGNYGHFIHSEIRDVRKQAYKNIYEVYTQYSSTLAVNYINFLKMCTSELELRKKPNLFYSCFYRIIIHLEEIV